MTPPRRRRRPGAGGSGGWSLFPSVSSRSEADENEWWLEREIKKLEETLAEHGELSRRELGRATNCKTWGPGRFGRALSEAVQQGRIKRVGFGRYAPAERG